jgi:transposase
MPWKTVTSMEEIIRFVLLARSGRFTITDLCEQFGISRKTGYKHLERYADAGLKGLQPRSHRPHHFPQRTEESVEALILTERKLHRPWRRRTCTESRSKEYVLTRSRTDMKSAYTSNFSLLPSRLSKNLIAQPLQPLGSKSANPALI